MHEKLLFQLSRTIKLLNILRIFGQIIFIKSKTTKLGHSWKYPNFSLFSLILFWTLNFFTLHAIFLRASPFSLPPLSPMCVLVQIDHLMVPWEGEQVKASKLAYNYPFGYAAYKLVPVRTTGRTGSGRPRPTRQVRLGFAVRSGSGVRANYAFVASPGKVNRSAMVG